MWGRCASLLILLGSRTCLGVSWFRMALAETVQLCSMWSLILQQTSLVPMMVAVSKKEQRKPIMFLEVGNWDTVPSAFCWPKQVIGQPGFEERGGAAESHDKGQGYRQAINWGLQCRLSATSSITPILWIKKLRLRD